MFNQIKISLFIFIMSLSLMFLSCTEENNVAEKTFRYIYYPVGSQDGADPSQMGLYRMSTEDSMFSRDISKYSVIYTSGIATNGVIVFENNTSMTRLEAVCEAGTVVPVPFPIHRDTSREYVLQTPPRMNVSFNGHYGAYFVWDKKKGSVLPEDRVLTFVKVSCSEGSIKTYTFEKFIKEIFDADGVDGVAPVGEYLYLNIQGDRVWFGLMFYKKDVVDYNKFAIVEFYNDEFSLRSPILDEPIAIVGNNLYSSHLITLVGDTVKTLYETKELISSKLAVENLSNPNQFAVARAEVVVWAKDGIELLNPSTGALLKSIIPYTNIDPTGQLLIRQNPRLSISPDGSYIVFGLPYKDNPNVYKLFMVDRDGKNLKKIAEMPMGIPKISNELKK